MTRQVLSRIFELSEPVPLKDTAWNGLHPDPSVRRYPRDAAALVAELGKEFSPEQLREANVTQADSGLPVRTLEVQPLDMVFLREKIDSPPYDLVTNHGALLTQEPPCLTANSDHHTAKALKKSKRLLLVSRVQEVAILRQVGFAVSVIAGVETMGGVHFDRLCGKPPVENVRNHDLLAPIRKEPSTELVFTAFDVAALRYPMRETVKAVAIRAHQVTEQFGFAAEFLKVWRPTSRELREIQLAVGLRANVYVRQSINRSLEGSVVELSSFAREFTRPVDFAAAEDALRAAIQRSRDEQCRFQSVDMAVRDYNALFASTVLQPLLKAAIAGTPEERPLRHRFVELTAELHATSPLLKASETAGTRDDNRRVSPKDDAYKLRRELFRELADLYRLLQTHSKQPGRAR